jgi:hypothetical protein
MASGHSTQELPMLPSSPFFARVQLASKASELIETVLKPKHVEPPPTGHQLNYITNYITNITIKWLGLDPSTTPRPPRMARP